MGESFGIRRAGLSLIEILASISLFTVAILVVVAGLSSLSKIQQNTFYRAQAANLAMVIGQYRAADMIRISALRLAGMMYSGSTTGVDLPTFGSGDKPYDYWNSASWKNTSAAVYHDAILVAASSYYQPDGTYVPAVHTVTNAVTTGGSVGDSWLDQCPLFTAKLDCNFSQVWTSFSKTDRFLHVQPPTFAGNSEKITAWGTVAIKGGSAADKNFSRLYQIDPSYLPTLSLDPNQSIGVSFSQPSDQTTWGVVNIKGRFLVASFWLGSRPGTVNGYGGPVTTAGSGTIFFLGHYLILDSLEP